MHWVPPPSRPFYKARQPYRSKFPIVLSHQSYNAALAVTGPMTLPALEQISKATQSLLDVSDPAIKVNFLPSRAVKSNVVEPAFCIQLTVGSAGSQRS